MVMPVTTTPAASLAPAAAAEPVRLDGGGWHRVWVHVFARWDGRVLLVRPAGGELWVLPADVPGPGETASRAACRVAGQVGLDVAADRMWLAGTQHSWGPQGGTIHLYFTPGLFHGIPQIANRGPYQELRWHDQRQLPSDVAEHVRVALDAYGRTDPYTETGWPQGSSA
jgi:ADP-ribose pyrophosphatase YjhB (NUDIX family)